MKILPLQTCTCGPFTKCNGKKHTTVCNSNAATGDKSASGHSRQVRTWQSLRFWFFWPGGGKITKTLNPEDVFWKPKGVGRFLERGPRNWVNAGDGFPSIDMAIMQNTKLALEDVFSFCMLLLDFGIATCKGNCLDLFEASEANPKQNRWWK